MFEELDRALVLFRLRAGAKCAEIAAFSGSRIDLSRIEAVPARAQFSNHWLTSSRAAHPLPMLATAFVMGRIPRRISRRPVVVPRALADIAVAVVPILGPIMRDEANVRADIVVRLVVV